MKGKNDYIVDSLEEPVEMYRGYRQGELMSHATNHWRCHTGGPVDHLGPLAGRAHHRNIDFSRA